MTRVQRTMKCLVELASLRLLVVAFIIGQCVFLVRSRFFMGMKAKLYRRLVVIGSIATLILYSADGFNGILFVRGVRLLRLGHSDQWSAQRRVLGPTFPLLRANVSTPRLTERKPCGLNALRTSFPVWIQNPGVGV